ncbi:MAG: hypothetical protein HC838_00160 [Spirulinaceae cyanobacterium RM2_2_10]|nr:hypothetical protein [Spirulinaceae cyanobacterium RM2_2_10]
MQGSNKLPTRSPQNENDSDIRVDVNLGDVANTLHTAAKELLKKEVTAATLNAACNAAQQITHLVRTHLEAKRLSYRLKTLKG